MRRQLLPVTAGKRSQETSASSNDRTTAVTVDDPSCTGALGRIVTDI
jgi:hypothetical protein